MYLGDVWTNCLDLGGWSEIQNPDLHNENQLSKDHYNDNVREIVVNGNK